MDNIIKAVFLDADNTIIDHKECERQALIYMFEKLNLEYKEEYQDIFRPLDRQLWDSVANSTNVISESEIPAYRFKVLFESLKIDNVDCVKANEYFQYGLSNTACLLENAKEMVEYLYNKKYKICVVTNGLIKLQKPRVINSEISKYLTDVIVSEEVGARKPNPQIFNILLDRIGLKNNEVVMIGDSLQADILGAKNSNIKSIWYNYKSVKNETNIMPDYEIKSLLEIKDLL